MAPKPKVSILCLSFNQKDFIKQTLEGFLMQKTDFGFEVLINDDASTDGTAQILKEYEKKYPDIVKPIYQKENQYSKGFRGMMTQNLFPLAKGTYLALCEGDDYWTDPQKLQLQVDFLDAHPDYAVCFHKVKIMYEDKSHEDYIYPDVPDETWYTTEQLLRANYIQTNSVMYRKQSYEDIATDVMPGDWYMHLYHAHFGKVKLIDRVMSVYRKHEGGVWWQYDVNRDEIWKKHSKEYARLLTELLKLYGDNKERHKIIDESVTEMIKQLMDVDKRHGLELGRIPLGAFPDVAQRFVAGQQEQIEEKSQAIDNLTKELLKVGDERANLLIKFSELEAINREQSNELNEIKKSRTLRAIVKARKLHAKIRATK